MSQRLLKRQLRSRQRAAENRKEERKKAAAARIAREKEESSEENDTVWERRDDRLDGLTYAPGTWFAPSTANPLAQGGSRACGGWLKGESCSGTFDDDFKRWAPAKSVPQKGKGRREKTTTGLKNFLRKSLGSARAAIKGTFASVPGAISAASIGLGRTQGMRLRLTMTMAPSLPPPLKRLQKSSCKNAGRS